jgi:hypothetical protein
MKGKCLPILAASVLASLPALAGLNPASPGLPTVAAAAIVGNATNVFSANVANNQMSAMCVDCHTLAPKTGMGTHFVAMAAGATNSGGSGVNATGAVATRDTGNFFRLALWSATGATGAATYSKYGNGTLSYVPATVNGVRTATAQGTLATYAGYEIICESCHNIVVNAAGGNNLLEGQSKAGNAVNDFTTTIVESEICVGCHGFMYTSNAANAAAPANANYADARNTGEIGGFRGNNEFHFAFNGTTGQQAYAQNHHVMTGDNIDSIRANPGLLWTDNLIVSYTDQPVSSASTRGTYPVGAAWTGTGIVKPAAGALTCTNCHAAGHGGGVTEGASILRNAVSTANAGAGRADAWSRISDAGAWKQIRDLQFCGQCHK